MHSGFVFQFPPTITGYLTMEGEKKNPSLCLNDMVVCKSPCGPRNVTVYPLLTIHTLMYVT